ncbi:sensor histidine kinase [Spongisporangium articulatum]|uniref:Sensor histidine kinase n=1 Tax=Spongisporangium articulatum TaxID=3362603 RepID=A0ABW8ASV4_9ACTN
MPSRQLQDRNGFLPLLLRSGIIVLAACITLGVSTKSESTDPATAQAIHPVEIVVPALLLLLVAAIASLPLSRFVPPLYVAVTETIVAAVIVGVVGPAGALFLLYLIVPLWTAAMAAGAVAGLACAATSFAVVAGVYVSWSLSSEGRVQTGNLTEPSLIAAMLCIFLGVPGVGAWMRRIRDESAPDSEPAYADAHRLLSELHVVARQLSLGLDPRTLAQALADDVRTVVPQATTVVLARSPGGRFVALVGEEPDDDAEVAIEDAWITASPVQRLFGDVVLTAVPVLMGERVVALVVLTTDAAIDRPTLVRCRAVIEQSGPRLASAMLFDDVRRLATTDERMRLAREIHDGIAQDLASVGYALDDIRRDAPEETAQGIASVRQQLQTMVADLRMSIFDLRAGVDDSVGLGTAISEHVQRVGAQSGLKVHISMDESRRRLPVSVEVEVLRIVQEAVANVRRHARARNLWLTVTVEPPRAHVQVIDDGRGLRPGRPDSFGITGMRERARRIGATLNVGPGPEGGTLVEIGLGTFPGQVPRDTGPLPRTPVTRESLTDPRGIPLLRPPARSEENRPATAMADVRGADQEVKQ